MANLSYTLFPAVVNMSITASVAVAVILLFKLFFYLFKISCKKIPTSIYYMMWLVVLFRLLCPVSISSQMSWFTRYESPVEHTGSNVSVLEYVPTDIVHTEFPAVDSPVDFADHLINYYLPQGEEQLRADPLEAPVAIATNIWLFGIFIMAVYGIYSYSTLKKQLAGSVKIRDNIYICDYITSPFVTGVIKPKIYLPSTLAEKEAEYIILHEQQHIKRFDHIFKLLAFTALAVHWFNPVVWLAYHLAVQDMEMSCDEAVIKKLGEDIRSAYSQSLLNLSTGRHIFAGTPLAFGEGDTKVRIKNLYNSGQATFVNSAFAALLAAFVVFTLAVNPDTSKGQILYNGMVYRQDGAAVTSLPYHSRDVGRLEEIVDENTPLTKELSGKNIDEINIHLPVFENEDIPDTIFLTTGDGWIPFRAVSMYYSTTEIWIEPKQIGKGVEYTIQLNRDVKEFGIVEDIYMEGKLYSSRLVSYCDSVQNLEGYKFTEYIDYEVKGNNEYQAFDEMDFIIKDNGVTAVCPVALPRDSYTGCGSYPIFLKYENVKKPRHKLLANDSFDLLTIAFSTMEDGGIYANFKAEYTPGEADFLNDTVIIYRLVTSSTSLKEQ